LYDGSEKCTRKFILFIKLGCALDEGNLSQNQYMLHIGSYVGDCTDHCLLTYDGV